MPHHAIGLIDNTSTVRPGFPFYVQGDFMALGGATRSLTNVEYETVVSLKNTSGAATATVIVHSARNMFLVSTSGTTVELVSGGDFTGLSGSIWISGVQYTIASITDADTLELTGSAGIQLRALAADSAPIASLSLATPSNDALLEQTLRAVAKTYNRYIGAAVTAISGTGAVINMYCRVY